MARGRRPSGALRRRWFSLATPYFLVRTGLAVSIGGPLGRRRSRFRGGFVRGPSRNTPPPHNLALHARNRIFPKWKPTFGLDLRSWRILGVQQPLNCTGIHVVHRWPKIGFHFGKMRFEAQLGTFTSPKVTIERRDTAARLQRARPRQISRFCSSHVAPLALIKGPS